jgi:phosphoribosylanthranilate isomerase
MTTIKICGITTVDDACTATELGADLLGFIFYEKSPRHISPDTAAYITSAVRGIYGQQTPRFVGVFVNEAVRRIQALLERIGLDIAQLHGDEPPAQIHTLAPRAFKALRPRTQAQAEQAFDVYRHTLPDDTRLPQLLIDAYHPEQLGGTGHRADLQLARWLAGRARLLLAGGLTPDNVSAAVEQIHPWGVDVSSGVELRPGVKDPARVRAFVQAVRSVAPYSSESSPCSRVSGSRRTPGQLRVTGSGGATKMPRGEQEPHPCRKEIS